MRYNIFSRNLMARFRKDQLNPTPRLFVSFTGEKFEKDDVKSIISLTQGYLAGPLSFGTEMRLDSELEKLSGPAKLEIVTRVWTLRPLSR